MLTAADLDHAIEVMEAAVKFDASDIQEMMFGAPCDKPNIESPPIREVTATIAERGEVLNALYDARENGEGVDLGDVAEALTHALSKITWWMQDQVIGIMQFGCDDPGRRGDIDRVSRAVSRMESLLRGVGAA